MRITTFLMFTGQARRPKLYVSLFPHSAILSI